MRSRSELKLIFGILIWIGLLSSGVLFARNAFKDAEGTPYKIAKFLSTPHRKVELQFTEQQVFRVGMPIFLLQDGLTAPVGRVVRVKEPDSTEKRYVWADRAYAELFSTAPEIGPNDYLTFHETPENFAWVMEMMLPSETRQQIGDLILSAYKDHQTEIVAAFRPIVEDSIRDASEIIGEDIRSAIAKRETELSRLGEKFRTNLIEKEIIPLVQREIWPVVQMESQPLVTEIGMQIWQEVSLWRFTWKYLYDSAPFPERNLSRKEFRRFVNTKAVPIIESHIGDIIEVQQRILSEVSQNERVKETVKTSIRHIMEDEEVQRLVTDIFREVFIDNPRLQEVLEKNWNSPKAQAALAMTNTRLESTITGIGQILFGSPDGEITPAFSRVLRSRILHKDTTWLVLHVGKAEGDETAESDSQTKRVLKVIPGKTSTENPFHIPANMSFEN